MIFGHFFYKLTLLCIVLLAFTESAYAATVNIETCPGDPDFACITSFENLEVFGIFYNVTIHKGSFDALFVNPEKDITYWGNESWAKEAVNSISIALNSLDPIPSKEITFFAGSFYGNTLQLPAEFSESTSNHFNSYCVQHSNTGPWGWSKCRKMTPTYTFAFATFSSATDPLPNRAPSTNTSGILITEKPVRVKKSGVTFVGAHKVPNEENTPKNSEQILPRSFNNNIELIIQYPNPERCNEELADQLPPNPGQEGEETIPGIDSDGDCIRDDLELIISDRLPNEKHYEARRYLYIHAIWLGELLKEDLTVEEAHEISNYLYGSSECVRKILGDSIETTKLLDWILANNLNTYLRSYRYIHNNALLGGTVSEGIPTIICE